MRIMGEPVKAERAAWLARIVADPAWGEPVRAVELPQPVKIPLSRDGRIPGLETRFTRQWVWKAGDETFGIMLWDVGHRVRPQRYVIEATGPAGRIMHERPIPLTPAVIEAALYFAGYPVDAAWRFA